MDLYTLDENIRRKHLIENYETLIWTERFYSPGDFKLVIQSTPDTRAKLKKDVWLATSLSDRVMKIETVDKKLSEGKVEILEITGRSIESLLEDRAAVYSMAPTYDNYKYYLYHTPGNMMRTLFYSTCLDGQVDPKDVFPFVQPVAGDLISSESHLREYPGLLYWLVEPSNLYEALKKLGDIYEMGFRLVRPAEDSKLYFYVYPGFNRTSNQSTHDAIIFSSALDNIENTSEISSNHSFKTVAYVTSSALNVTVYEPGVDPNATGFERRVLHVDAGDVGTAPLSGPEPQLGEPPADPPLPDVGTQPDPPAPYLGFPEENMGMEGRALWEEQYQADMNAFYADRAAQVAAWRTNRDALMATWQADRDAAILAWHNAYTTAHAAWVAANTVLYNDWIAELEADLIQKGLEELAKHKKISAFDGEINQHSEYKYNQDYFLGDLVEMRDEDGDVFIKRVTEQIFVSDKEGERAYPTLSETVRTT